MFACGEWDRAISICEEVIASATAVHAQTAAAGILGLVHAMRGSSRLARTQLVEANLAASRPLLIVVDDAHWADEPSLRWLAYLAPRLEGLAAGLLVALRPGDPAVSIADTFSIHDTDFRFTNVSTTLVEQLANFRSPRRGTRWTCPRLMARPPRPPASARWPV